MATACKLFQLWQPKCLTDTTPFAELSRMEFKNRLVRFATQLRQSDGQLYERTTMLTFFRSLQRILTLDYTARLRGVNPKEPP